VANPDIKLMCVANVYVRQMTFQHAGDIELGHTHPFDHSTLVSAGKVRVTVNDVATEYAAPTMIFIKAEEFHKLEALEDGTVVSCIHALRDGHGVEDIVDPASIPEGVTLCPGVGSIAVLTVEGNPERRANLRSNAARRARRQELRNRAQKQNPTE
jgi:quercetin dioxygenase-like cupin family protein/heme exporter protein D